MTEKILVVEDDITLQETLAYNLARHGYDVNAVGDGETALETARRFHPDLILLDIMLPTMDGFDVCRILRQEMIMPILVLTARDDEIDRVLGLEMGADDYLTKPFSMRELLARVKALLRRVQFDRDDFHPMLTSKKAQSVDENSLQFGTLTIKLKRREITLHNVAINMKPKEYDLLLFLARHKGQVLPRELILDRVWGWDFSGGSRTVDVHIRWLREKIEEDPANPERIVTVRGIGYRFDG
ncbi:MAG: response regulator transcription factor [Anaerolineales bacterium]|nr:response regulator transcription factor [Anaerolineales bacterium]